MQKTPFNKCFLLSLAAGCAVFLGFPKFNLWPTTVLFAFFSIHLSRNFISVRWAFLWGFWVSCIIMIGGFYWVTYVIHVFGYLPWSVAILLFACFCGLGALNFPLAAVGNFIVERRLLLWKNERKNERFRGTWYAIGYPALFTVVEYLVPKLFPWQLGHALYQTFWLNQIVEITGTTFLSFLLMSWGSALTVCFVPPRGVPRVSWKWCLVPAALTVVIMGFSAERISRGVGTGKKMKVAIIQANIGNLDKVAARNGFSGKLRFINDQYEAMTETVLSMKPDLSGLPDLIVWPETALAYRLGGKRDLAMEIEAKVLQWKVPLVTGAYAPGDKNPSGDYNAAYLVEPVSESAVSLQSYGKNVLLAFGEYMPFGEWFPILYRWFPQVSHFERNDTQTAFVMRDGTRLGISICYEMILPDFMRKVARHRPHLFVNLTNDSWFGPTAEPYLHGAISIFRSIEHRIPSIRSTNTGTSFVVDALGRVSERTGVYEPATLIAEVELSESPSPTFYGRWGDWFIAVCGALVIGLGFLTKGGPKR